MQRSAPRHPPLQRCIFTLRNLEKVQLWMHPPTSINDRAGPPDPPCWLIKCFLGLVVSLKALWGWFNLALRFVSIVASRKLIFFFFLERNTYLVSQQSSRLKDGDSFLLSRSCYCHNHCKYPHYLCRWKSKNSSKSLQSLVRRLVIRRQSSFLLKRKSSNII